jgi:CheY-specific phosphatase CheX
MQASDFTPLVNEYCAEVLDSMYFTTVLEISHPPDQQPAPAPDALAFSLRFQGDVHGTFGISLSLSMARTLASNFLGEEERDLTEAEVAEVVGELTNMLCGSILSRVIGTSKFALSHPQPFLPAYPAPATPSCDMLTSDLETDSGILQTWVTVDHPFASRENSDTEILQAAH